VVVVIAGVEVAEAFLIADDRCGRTGQVGQVQRDAWGRDLRVQLSAHQPAALLDVVPRRTGYYERPPGPRKKSAPPDGTAQDYAL
jgi:hypothetical protein